MQELIVKNASAFLPRRAQRVSAFHCARLRSAVPPDKSAVSKAAVRRQRTGSAGQIHADRSDSEADCEKLYFLSVMQQI